MPDKKRVLFVDDEPRVLDGIRRMMHIMRKECDPFFAESGEAALEELSKGPVDVIISDMRMPGMDGAELLSEVKERHPKTVRIALSGQTEKGIIIRSVAPTHQFLAKPCSTDDLRSTLVRACALRDLLNSDQLQELLSQMEALPSLPSTYNELIKELQSPNTSIKNVERIISQDLGMTVKILQMVNSAFFGLRKHVSSPGQAVVLLGLDTIKALALSAGVFSQFDQFDLKGLSLETLWKHSMAVGGLAKQIAKTEVTEQEAVDYAFIGGMLHDVGKLVFAAKLPEEYKKVLALSNEKGIEATDAEREVIGTTHAEVGGFLLGLWGFSQSIVDALAYHHNPFGNISRKFSTLTAVHVANALVYETQTDKPSDNMSSVDENYLAELGLREKLPIWREICQEIGQKEGKKNEQEDTLR